MKRAATFVVVGVGITLLVGCVTRPLPPRPSVTDLVEQSLDQSISRMEVGDPVFEQEYIEEYGEIVDDDFHFAGDDGMLQPGYPDELENLLPIDDPMSYEVETPRVTEEFIETDVSEALRLMIEDAGLDLIIDDQVVGVINTRIDDLPIEEAIEKVLMPLGFVFARHDNQIIICPPDPTSPLFSYVAGRTEFRPRFSDPKTLVEAVPERLKQYVQLIDGSNLIVVEAPERITNQIVDRFFAIDQPIPQVVLEAIICVISPDSGFQFGLDWQHAVQLNGENALKLGASGLAISSNYSRAGANAIFDDFAATSAFVKLLSEHGYLTIRATPHVMAQDGQEANIQINRETFFSVQPNSGNNAENSSFFFQQDIQTVESGITLDITPQIRGDIVTINIEKAEVSEDIRNANTELALNPFPIINRRSVSTTVHVKDGRTIVIGGLVQRETVDRVNRVPGLSKLPGVGYLFESTQRQSREAEVVIFISPRIVTPPTLSD